MRTMAALACFVVFAAVLVGGVVWAGSEDGKTYSSDEVIQTFSRSGIALSDVFCSPTGAARWLHLHPSWRTT